MKITKEELAEWQQDHDSHVTDLPPYAALDMRIGRLLAEREEMVNERKEIMVLLREQMMRCDYNCQPPNALCPWCRKAKEYLDAE